MGEARFFKRARPRDRVEMKLTLTKLRAPLAIFDGEARVGATLLTRVEGLKLAFGEFNPAHFDASSSPPSPADDAGE